MFIKSFNLYEIFLLLSSFSAGFKWKKEKELAEKLDDFAENKINPRVINSSAVCFRISIVFLLLGLTLKISFFEDYQTIYKGKYYFKNFNISYRRTIRTTRYCNN